MEGKVRHTDKEDVVINKLYNKFTSNGYVTLLKDIIFVMIPIIGWFSIILINDIKTDIKELKIFSINHMEHHRKLESEDMMDLKQRLIYIETILTKKLK